MNSTISIVSAECHKFCFNVYNNLELNEKKEIFIDLFYHFMLEINKI